MAAGEGEVKPVCASSDSSHLQQTQPGCGGKVLPASAFCHVIFHGLLAYEFTICHCQGSFSSPVFLIFSFLPLNVCCKSLFIFFPLALHISLAFFIWGGTHFFFTPDCNLPRSAGLPSLSPFCYLQQPCLCDLEGTNINRQGRIPGMAVGHSWNNEARRLVLL